MAHNIILSELEFQPPDQIRGFEDNMILIRWALQHCRLDGNWLSLKLFSCSRAELRTLSDSVSNNQIPELRFDFQSVLCIFSHLSQFVRFTQEQTNEISQAISDKHATMENVLRGFFPAQAGDSLYKIWCEWASLGFKAWSYMRIKTYYSYKICELFGPFKKTCDELKPALNLLVLGQMQKPECQRLGAAAIAMQAPMIEAVQGYFEAELEVEYTPIQIFLRNWLEGVTCHEQLSVPMLKNAKRQSRLHLLICHVVPDSIRSWGEVGTCGSDINDFFTELRSTVVDASTIMTGKIPSKKSEVLSMRSKVAEALRSPLSLEQITLLQQDLSNLFKSLLEMQDFGIPFRETEVGADRSEVDQWRTDIMLSYTAIKKAREELEKTDEAQSEAYQKSLKTRKLPQSNQPDWCKFLFIWRTESSLYASDQIRLNIIRSHLTDAVDKASTEHYTEYTQLMAYLYKRYGSESTVYLTLLKEIMQLQRPKTDKEEEQNLARINAVTSICNSPQNILMFTSDRVAKIVQGFSDKSRDLFYDRLYDEKSSLRGQVPVQDWEETYEQKFHEHRLKFLNLFLEKRLFNLRHSNISQSASGKLSHIQSRVTDQAEKWTCPLCHTQHRKGTNKPRPYLSVCEVFIAQSAQEKQKTKERLNLCPICTQPKTVHKGERCPRWGMLYCSICKGRGFSERALTHSTIMHRDVDEQNGHGGGGNSGDRGGRGGRGHGSRRGGGGRGGNGRGAGRGARGRGRGQQPQNSDS